MQFPTIPTTPLGGTPDTRPVRETEHAAAVRPVTPEAPQPVPLPQPQAPVAGPEADLPERRRGDRRKRQFPVLLDTRTGGERRRAEAEPEVPRRRIDERA